MLFKRFSILLPPRNYITFHYLYFIIAIFIFSLIFWLSSRLGESVEYIDCLFMVTSAMTETGLATVNLSQINTFQQVLLFLLMIGGNSIFVSYFVVLVRKRAFESRFSELDRVCNTAEDSVRDISHTPDVQTNTSDSTERQYGTVPFSAYSSAELGYIPASFGNPSSAIEKGRSAGNILQYSGTNDATCSTTSLFYSLNGAQTGSLKDLQKKDYTKRLSNLIVKRSAEDLDIFHEKAHSTGFLNSMIHPLSRSTDIKDGKSCERIEEEQLKQNTWLQNGFATQNLKLDHSPHELTSIPPLVSDSSSNCGPRIPYANRVRLGGTEYGALRFLTYLIPIYFILLQVLGCVSSALYIASRRREVANSNAINPWWLGIFLGVSAFTNCGLSLLDSGMAPFEKDIFFLVILSFLILCGNVAYPIVLRSIFGLLGYMMPKVKAMQDCSKIVRFILDHPRRVYTNVFPAAHTWWLFFALIVLTGVDWLSFFELNLQNQEIGLIPNSFRQALIFFQSVSIRSAGFSVVPIGMLAIGTQVITIVMMYISAYPILIPLRSSNIYEEQSLGIYRGDLKKTFEKENEDVMKGVLSRLGLETKFFFFRQQLQYQLAHDIWWLAISIILIVCLEADHYENDPITYSVFNMIFEAISAYGPVGLSTGLPNQAFSLSGGFHTSSKVLICAVMIRGRHRGLPVAIDRAVLLPSEKRYVGNRATSV